MRGTARASQHDPHLWPCSGLGRGHPRAPSAGSGPLGVGRRRRLGPGPPWPAAAQPEGPGRQGGSRAGRLSSAAPAGGG